MWAHQYVQLSNQIACQKFPSWPIFRTNNSEAHLFGLEPNFGCCTSNFNQGWPKLALSAFMYSRNNVISAIPIPSSLCTEELSVKLETNYPFENRFEYSVSSAKDIKLTVRIPSFAKNILVNGEAVCYSEELSFDVKSGESRIISIEYNTTPELIDRPHNLKSVRAGSLVFSLPISYEKKMIEYERDGVERKFPYCDYEYLPTSDWSYAYSSPFFTAEKREISNIPFSSENPPVVLKAKVKSIAWGLEDGYESLCAKTPDSRIPLGEEKEIELYPYGCAKLRMTELPLI
jgi:hypothetical protein